MKKGTIAAVVAIIIFGVLAFWLTREKKNDQARREILNVLDRELSADEAAIKAQREKVSDLTRRVEALRSMIQLGEVKNGKAAVAEFNALAAQQRAEREKFTQMADTYNKKVAQYRDIQE